MYTALCTAVLSYGTSNIKSKLVIYTYMVSYSDNKYKSDDIFQNLYISSIISVQQLSRSDFDTANFRNLKPFKV